LLLDREKRELYLCRTDHTTLLFALTEPEDGRVTGARSVVPEVKELYDLRYAKLMADKGITPN